MIVAIVTDPGAGSLNVAASAAIKGASSHRRLVLLGDVAGAGLFGALFTATLVLTGPARSTRIPRVDARAGGRPRGVGVIEERSYFRLAANRRPT